MGSIHGITYLILGVLVSGLSYFINYRNRNNSLILFFYVGLIFVFIGILKLVAMAIRKKPKKRLQHVHMNNNKNYKHMTVRFCNNCGGRLRHTDHYCPMCGHSLHQLR